MQIKLSDNLQLQPINLNDQLKLMSLLHRIYPPVYKHLWKNEDCSFYFEKFFNPDNLHKELSIKDADYHFVVYNLKTVGILRVQYNKQFLDLPDKSSAYIHRIYLGEEAQGKGVAKQLFEWIEERASINGNDLLWLKVMDTQQQALRFYQKEGFVISGTTKLKFELLKDHLRGMYLMYKLI